MIIYNVVISQNKKCSNLLKLENNILKADISGPTDFVHIQGTKQYDGGFSKIDNLDQIDPNLRQLFEMANINFGSLDSAQKKQIKKWADSKKTQSQIKHFGTSIRRQQEQTYQPPPSMASKMGRTHLTPKNGKNLLETQASFLKSRAEEPGAHGP